MFNFAIFRKVKVSPKYEIVAEKAYVGKAEPCILKTPLPALGSDAAKNWANEKLPQFGPKKSKQKAAAKKAASEKRKEEEIREDLAKFMENRPARMKGKVSGLRTRWEGLPGVNDDGTLLPRWQIKDSSFIITSLKSRFMKKVISRTQISNPKRSIWLILFRRLNVSSIKIILSPTHFYVTGLIFMHWQIFSSFDKHK